MSRSQKRIPINQRFADVILAAEFYNKFPSFYFSLKELRRVYSKFVGKNVSKKEISNLIKRLEHKAIIWDRLGDDTEVHTHSEERFSLPLEMRHCASLMVNYL